MRHAVDARANLVNYSRTGLVCLSTVCSDNHASISTEYVRRANSSVHRSEFVQGHPSTVANHIPGWQRLCPCGPFSGGSSILASPDLWLARFLDKDAMDHGGMCRRLPRSRPSPQMRSVTSGPNTLCCKACKCPVKALAGFGPDPAPPGKSANTAARGTSDLLFVRIIATAAP